MHGSLDEPPIFHKSDECFDVFGESVPTRKTLDYLIFGHICINCFYVLHLVWTKWPKRFLVWDLDNAPFPLNINPREWWLVSQDLGYVLLDFMYMAAVPAGIYTVHRELSRAAFPHPDSPDKDEFDWEEFQVIYFWFVIVIGVLGMGYLRARFRGNVRERQQVRDGTIKDGGGRTVAEAVANERESLTSSV